MENSTLKKWRTLGKYLPLFSLFVLMPAWADMADEHEETENQLVEEVFRSGLVYPQESGEVQITLLPQYGKNDSAKQWELPISIEYGITDQLQIELEWISYVQNNPNAGQTNDGIGDLEVGMQYSWMEIGGGSIHAAVGVEFGIPTGDDEKELGEGEKSIESFLIVGADISRSVHSFLQVGVEYIYEEEEESVEEWVGFANIGVIVAASTHSALTLEYNWIEEEAQYVTPGFIWHPGDDWELGLGVPIGVNDDADDYQIILHGIYEFEF